MKFVSPVAFAALSILALGCERPASDTSATSSNGTVAILDLDDAAKRLGRDVAITEQLKAQNDALVEKVTKSRDELRKQFEDQRQSFGDKPSDADAQKLAALGQNLQAQLQAKQDEAREELAAKQASLITQFREEIKPVAQKIAEKKGFHTVLLRSDGVVLWSDHGTDITDDVVGELAGAGKASPTATPSASTSPTASPTATP